MAFLEKAAGQGLAYAMQWLGNDHHEREEFEQAVGWLTKAAEAGLPGATFNLGCYLEEGKGMAAPDYPAALYWYKRAANAGSSDAAVNLSHMYTAGRGGAWHIMSATPSTF